MHNYTKKKQIIDFVKLSTTKYLLSIGGRNYGDHSEYYKRPESDSFTELRKLILKKNIINIKDNLL